MYNISGYNCIDRNRANFNRGGKAMYIKYGFEYCERPDISINEYGQFERLFIVIKSVEHKIIITNIYIIPDTTENTSVALFNNILEKLNTKNCNQILAKHLFSYKYFTDSIPESFSNYY